MNKYRKLLNELNIHEKLNDDEIIPKLDDFLDSKITMIKPKVYRLENKTSL